MTKPPFLTLNCLKNKTSFNNLSNHIQNYEIKNLHTSLGSSLNFFRFRKATGANASLEWMHTSDSSLKYRIKCQ